jgi:flagellum-specific peptidoglycan hydrolase FlgJ
MKLNITHVFLILCTTLLVVSCGGTKSARKNGTTVTRVDKRTRTTPKDVPVIPNKDPKTTTDKPVFKDGIEAYVYEFKDVAVREMQLYRIPASITLAQGILESGSGKGRLAVEANNHFGIKCHSAWTGGRIYHDDDELQECFRKYKDASYSYRDHSLFLTERKRYAWLFDLPISDYKAWAKGLRKSGYATDKKYPQKLISLIERYELYKYDALVTGEAPQVPNVPPKEIHGTYVVKAGDTLFSIAKKYDLSVEQLKSYNDLASNALSIGQLLKIQPTTKEK